MVPDNWDELIDPDVTIEDLMLCAVEGCDLDNAVMVLDEIAQRTGHRVQLWLDDKRVYPYPTEMN